MIQRALKAIFGSRNERLLKQFRKTVTRINALEPDVAALTDDALIHEAPAIVGCQTPSALAHTAG